MDEIFFGKGEEWLVAESEQLQQKGFVSEYAWIAKENEYAEGCGHEDFKAEQFAAWMADSTNLCPEMKVFFDENFLE